MVRNTKECPHGVVLRLDQRPPGWSEDGEGCKDGSNPFQLYYNGDHYVRFHYFDNEQGIAMREEFAIEGSEKFKEVVWLMDIGCDGLLLGNLPQLLIVS